MSPMAAAPPVVFETAGEHLCRNVPITTPEATAGEIRSMLIGRRYDCASGIAVCSGGRLVGLLAMEDILGAAEGARARELMDADPPIVGPGADQEHAAWKAVQHGESSLAVVDAAGSFLGLIPPQRLLAVLLGEHHEDLARISGFLENSLPAKASLEESVWRRLYHRLPWLGVGLAGVLVAADLVAAFSRQIEAHVILAFFLPGIVYLADAVGTQTETLVVRGLSVGVPIARVVWRELWTGLLIGLGLAGAAMGAALWRWGAAEIVLVLGGSLLAACSVATLVAVALPWALHRLGGDPAFGSGPLATVIQDLLSIAIYFGIAAAVLG
jgi:magnesium transporter